MEGAQHGKSVRNMEKGICNMEKVFATWEKVFATLKKCSQHSQHASQHHDPTAGMFPNSNRVAGKVSDPPGASSTETRIVKKKPSESP
jgi:hypothetical protein